MPPRSRRNRKQPISDNLNKLAPEYFSELNALLYQSVPTNYFRMRLASAALQLNPTREILEARNEVSVGVLKAEWFMPGDDTVRREFVALEVTVLLHHAAETLLRMYLAHAEHPNCPWLEVTGLTDYRKFKETLAEIVKNPTRELSDDKLAAVFLGGKDPDEAGICLGPGEWEGHIKASRELLSALAKRLLEEANLYNTAKHGLAGVVDSSTEMAIESPDGEKVSLNKGPSVAYPTRSKVDDVTGKYLKWQMAIDSISIDTDMLTVELACKFLDSLFAVARRRYVGTGGSIWICNMSYVLATLLNGYIQADRKCSGMIFDMATVERDGNGNRRLGSIGIGLKVQHISEDTLELLNNFSPESDEPRQIPLPPLERFRRTPTGKGMLLPISPPGSQSELASP